MKQTLKYVNKSPNPNPVYAKAGDSGFDLRAWITKDDKNAIYNGIDGVDDGRYSIELRGLERRLIHTGLYFELPENTEVQVRPRSGNALKLGLTVLNTPGTVDVNYTGEICVIVINLSHEPIVINNGDRIAQGVLMPVFNEPNVDLVEVKEIEENTARGNDGFGSTGKN